MSDQAGHWLAVLDEVLQATTMVDQRCRGINTHELVK